MDGPISSFHKLISSPDQIAIIYEDKEVDDSLLGFIKYGYKDLYLYRKGDNGRVDYIKFEQVFCLLDFYVKTNKQRSGIGLALFQNMLSDAAIDPRKIAYDRPSNLLSSFLAKHFDLHNPDVQPNRYAIYDGFFHP